jgi:hypothetical protein
MSPSPHGLGSTSVGTGVLNQDALGNDYGYREVNNRVRAAVGASGYWLSNQRARRLEPK